MDECIVYLSEIFLNGDGTLSAYVDFRTEKDIALFKEYSNSTAEFGNERSIIFLSSFTSSKRLIHDCYYKLNLGLLNQYPFSDEQELGIVGRSYFLYDMPYPNDDASELLQSHEQLDPSVWKDVLEERLSDGDKVGCLTIVTDLENENRFHPS